MISQIYPLTIVYAHSKGEEGEMNLVVSSKQIWRYVNKKTSCIEIHSHWDEIFLIVE